MDDQMWAFLKFNLWRYKELKSNILIIENLGLMCVWVDEKANVWLMEHLK